MNPSTLRLCIAVTPALTTEFRRVRLSSARRASSAGKQNWIKRFIAKRLFVEKVYQILSCVSSFFERVDVSAQPSRIAKPQGINTTFLALKADVSSPPFAQLIVFFASALLDNSGKLPCTFSNADRYQSMRCNVLMCSIVRKTHAPGWPGILAACRSADKNGCLMATRKAKTFVGVIALQTQFGKAQFSIGASAALLTCNVSRCESSKSAVPLDTEAVGLLRWLRLVFPVQPESASRLAVLRVQKTPFLFFLPQFDWMNVFLVLICGRRLLVTSKHWALRGLRL